MHQWQPTSQLRWVERETYDPDIITPIKVKVLQQLWVCRNTGKQEWRDVPTEEE